MQIEALNSRDYHPFVEYQYGIGYDSPRKRDIVKNSPTIYPSYYPVNYPFTNEDLLVDVEKENGGDFADPDIRLYPKRDEEIKYLNDEHPTKEKNHLDRHLYDQSVLKIKGNGGFMDYEKVVKHAVKFSEIRKHLDKAKNSNAVKLLKEIQKLLELGNELRAESLMKRYKKRYA